MFTVAHLLFSVSIFFLMCFALPPRALALSRSAWDDMLFTAGVRYDYLWQMNARQILMEVHPYSSANNLIPSFSYFPQVAFFSAFCGLRNTSDKKNVLWRFRTADLVWKNIFWSPPLSPEEQDPFGFAPEEGLADVSRVTVLDFNRTGTAEIMDYIAQYGRGISFVDRSGYLSTDITVIPTIGLATYRLGSFYSNHFGPDADKGYFGVSADVTGTAELAYKRQALSVDVSSRHIIAGQSVHFLTFGATATLLLPVFGGYRLPGIQCYVRGEREFAYFGDGEVGTTTFSAGLRVPVAVVQRF